MAALQSAGTLVLCRLEESASLQDFTQFPSLHFGGLLIIVDLIIVDHMEFYPPAQRSTCEGHVIDSAQISSELNIIHKFLPVWS